MTTHSENSAAIAAGMAVALACTGCAHSVARPAAAPTSQAPRAGKSCDGNQVVTWAPRAGCTDEACPLEANYEDCGQGFCDPASAQCVDPCATATCAPPPPRCDPRSNQMVTYRSWCMATGPRTHECVADAVDATAGCAAGGEATTTQLREEAAAPAVASAAPVPRRPVDVARPSGPSTPTVPARQAPAVDEPRDAATPAQAARPNPQPQYPEGREVPPLSARGRGGQAIIAVVVPLAVLAVVIPLAVVFKGFGSMHAERDPGLGARGQGLAGAPLPPLIRF